MVRLPPNLLRHVTFPHSDAVGVSSVPDRLKLYGEKLQVIPKRDTHLVNLGRGDRYTKFEVNRTNIKHRDSWLTVYTESQTVSESSQKWE